MATMKKAIIDMLCEFDEPATRLLTAWHKHNQGFTILWQADNFVLWNLIGKMKSMCHFWLQYEINTTFI
jgi:hypothetical protein